MTLENKPTADVEIDESLVRALLEEQHPDLAALPLEHLAAGWDNELYRLGADLIVRLPRREMSAELVAHEQRWLPALAPTLPLPISAPVRNGQPGCSYPWAWSIAPWLPGAMLATSPPRDLHATADSLGAFVRALHVPAPSDAPHNPYRSGPLSDRGQYAIERAQRLDGVIDGARAIACWEQLSAVPYWPGPKLWMHGDMHPANLLVHDGVLSGVIDFGDISAGDPAADLSCAWMIFPAELRPVFRTAAGAIDDDTWQRARGWALALGLTFLANSADSPVMGEIGARTVAELLDED